MVKHKTYKRRMNVQEALNKDFDSFFVSDDVTFDTMSINSSNERKIHYVSQCQDDTNIYHKSKRKIFIEQMNKWLKEAILYDDYVSNNIEEDDIIDTGDKHRDIPYDEIKEYEKLSLKKKDVLSDITKEIVDIVENAGFTLHDLNKFKEDLTYFFYRVSD